MGALGVYLKNTYDTMMAAATAKMDKEENPEPDLFVVVDRSKDEILEFH